MVHGLIERAFLAALDVGESVQRGALRSRLNRFAQLGLPVLLEDQEGRRLYSQEECHQMLVPFSRSAISGSTDCRCPGCQKSLEETEFAPGPAQAWPRSPLWPEKNR